jgi:hypothetical protein
MVGSGLKLGADVVQMADGGWEPLGVDDAFWCHFVFLG